MISWRTPPSAVEVCALIQDARPEAEMVAEVALVEVTQLARGYTRGAGFRTVVEVVDDVETARREVADDIGAVIILAAARLAPNGEQSTYRYLEGEHGESRRGSFAGWTLAERLVLDRYRTRLGIA